MPTMAFPSQPQAIPQSSQAAPNAMHCPKCHAALLPGFVACPMCGTPIVSKVGATPALIAIMHGLGIIAVILFFAAPFIVGNDQAAKVVIGVILLMVAGALGCAIVLVCRRSITDRINGWAVIALQAVAMFILVVGRMSRMPVEAPNAQRSDSRPYGYGQPAYQGQPQRAYGDDYRAP